MSRGNNLKSDLRFISQAMLNPRKKRCLYLGWVGHANLGDEALKETIFDLFSSRLVFAERQGALVRLFQRLNLFRFDILMLGGGTLLLRSQEILDAMQNSRIPQKVVFGTGVANQSFWKDVPDSYGDFTQWKNLLEGLDYLGVRGPISQTLLKNIGLQRNIPVIGDPVLYFTRPLIGVKSKKKKLGVNIGTARHARLGELLWGHNEAAFMEKFSEFLRFMRSENWEIEFVPVSPKDIPVIESVIEKSGGKGHIGIFKDYHSVQMTLDRLESYDLFVGEKLHSVVLAYCANTPAIMIEYRPKCRDFMSSIGMEKFNIRTDEFTLERILPMCTDLYKNLEQYRATSNKACLEFKSTIELNAKQVMQVMGE